jgi:hypothetical protein
MKEKLDPARTLIQKFHGAAHLSRITGIKINTICSWESKGVGDGRIPTRHWKTLKDAAIKQGFTLSAAQLSGEESII